MGEYSATGFDAPTLRGMQAEGTEDGAGTLSALPLLVVGWDGLQPALPKISASMLVVTTTRIAALHWRFAYTRIAYSRMCNRQQLIFVPGQPPQ